MGCSSSLPATSQTGRPKGGDPHAVAMAELDRLLKGAYNAAALMRPVSPAKFAIEWLQERVDAEVAERTLAATRLQACWRSHGTRIQLGKKEAQKGNRANLLITMDPGQDLDDEMLLVLLAAMTDRSLVSCCGVVTCLAPSGMRAQLARGTLDLLGLPQVPVHAGSDGGGSGDASMISSTEYLTRMQPAVDTGAELMRNVLNAAAPRSITLLVVSSFKDAAAWMQEEEDLIVDKVARVVVQGGVKDFKPGVALPGNFLEPDDAHNNVFDRDASEFFYRRCQVRGLPMVILSRFAAYAAPLPRSLYDDLAATGSPIGRHLQHAQRTSIEQLWRRACAPADSAVHAICPLAVT